MNCIRPALMALLACVGLTGAAMAAAPAGAAGPGGAYTEKGADTCLYCHDADADTATFTTAAIFRTPHARRGDPHGPFGPQGLQCEACHGPGGRHASEGSDKKATINSFKPGSFLDAAQRNESCLSCHQGGTHKAWRGSAHDTAGLACTDCHQLHAERDKVMARSTQPEVCYKCHRSQRAEFHKASAHPVDSGRMACSDCHNPHGSAGPRMLAQPTLNETCYGCHADKRGPVLWEHAPVAEDCSLCHTAHGSVRPALLAKSPPLLCQQCHSVSGHPSVARTATGLPGGGAGGEIFLVAGSCTNCHVQVHGSNHPAGAALMR